MGINLYRSEAKGELLPPDALSDEERAIVQAELWQFLGRQTRLYTADDSSSVPVETAEELLSSICFILDAYITATGSGSKLLSTEKLDILFEGGLKIIEARIEDGKSLWQTACLSAPEVENISYRDTLRNIGLFWKRYDYRFFAHQIPCDIDYQLCRPVPERNQGIAYINEYLRRIIVENSILHLYSKDLTIQLLKRYCSDYKGLLINLCEPVIANAVGLALIGVSPFSLQISNSDRSKIEELFERLSDSKARSALMSAAKSFCSEARITDRFTYEYVAKTAIDLYPRIAAALPTGNLSGIFLSFD
jgi:hypothetical protein